MSTLNVLHVRMPCPRRGHEADMEVECFFGFGNLIDYKIGDRVVWNEAKAVKHGGRPPGGNLDGEGYLVCPVCQLDAFVLVIVRDDLIVGVQPDSTRSGYIPESATPP